MFSLARKLIFAAAATIACMPAVHSRQLTAAETDSVSVALGTIWGTYIKNKSTKESPAITVEYMRGLNDALKLSGHNDAYVQGFSEALQMLKRVEQAEKTGGYNVNRDRFAYALDQSSRGRRTGFSAQSAETYMNTLMMQLEQEKKTAAAQIKYLEQEARRPGVIKTPSGLLFEVITEGEGPMPDDSCAVIVAYTGKLIDGTVFNATDPGKGRTFEVRETIPGFREALKMMRKGGIYHIVVPADLGYGDDGVMGRVPPGATTIFDVTLHDMRTFEQLRHMAAKAQQMEGQENLSGHER